MMLDPSLSTFVDWLLQSTLAGLLAAGAALVITSLLGDRMPARFKHVLWMIVLLRLILPVLPSSPIALPHLLVESGADSVKSSTAWTVQFDNAAPAAESVAGAQSAPSHRPVDWRAVLLAVWLVGALTVIARSAWAYQRLVRALQPIAAPPVHVAAMLAEIAATLRIRRIPRLAMAPVGAGPALVGAFRPTVLLPADLLTIGQQRTLRAVLLHELIHVRRHDGAVELLITLMQALHWFNPVAWFVARQIRIEREFAVDAQAVSTTTLISAPDYGVALLELSQRRWHAGGQSTHVGAVPGFGAAVLKRRIRAVVANRPASRAWTLASVGLLTLIAGCTLTRPAVPSPVTVTSEDPAAVDTRVYDIRDLIISLPHLVAPDDPEDADKQTPSRETLVREIIQWVTDEVSPDTWADRGGRGTIREMEGQLIVTQTPRVHAGVVTLLETERRKRGRQVQIESRLISIDPRALSTRMRSRLRDARHGTSPRLTNEELAQLLSGGQQLTTPRVTVFVGQRAYVTLANDAGGILSRAIADQTGEADGERVVVDVAAYASDDPQSVDLWTAAHLVRFSKQDDQAEETVVWQTRLQRAMRLKSGERVLADVVQVNDDLHLLLITSVTIIEPQEAGR